MGDVRSKVLLIHGEADPRPEPGELDAIRAVLPTAQLALLPGAGHNPQASRRQMRSRIWSDAFSSEKVAPLHCFSAAVQLSTTTIACFRLADAPDERL